jgi:hypothetical protein
MQKINKPVYDSATGQWKDEWHDIYVTFDKATGNITGTYDTLTGEYGGYSAKLENEIKTSGSKIKTQMEELQKSLLPNGGGIKLDSDNNAINATTDQLITQLDNVIQKEDGAKTAIQDINGTKVRLEFDKDGILTNANDVQDAIRGKFDNNPAVVKTKIEVDGKSLSSTDSIIKKLKDLPQDKKVKIDVNGEEAIITAEQAEKKINDLPKDKDVDIKVETDDSKINEIKGQIDNLPDKKECKITIDGTEETNIDNVNKKLSELPPDTKVDIIINGEQISTAGEAKAKLDAIPKETDTTIKADNTDANQKADETTQKMGEVDQEQATPKIDVDAGNSFSVIDSIKNFFSWVSGKVFHATVQVDKTGASTDGGDGYASGTDSATQGFHDTAEDGFEIVVGRKKRYFNGGEKVLNHDDSVQVLNEMMNGKKVDSSVNNQEQESIETISVSMPKLNSAKKKGVSVPADHDDGYFPSLQGGDDSSSSSSSSKASKKAESEAKKEASKAETESKKAESEAKKAEKFKEEIERLHSTIDIDPYYEENNALKDVENQLTANETAMELMEKNSPEYQQAQLKEIDLYNKKRDALLDLNTAQKGEADAIKQKLSQYSFYFDANGQLINSETRLKELEDSINAETGDDDKAKQKKQDDLNWLKDINDLVKKYGTLTRDTIPKTADDYNKLAVSIKNVADEMKKANEETINSLRDEAVQDYLKDQQDKVDELKKEAEQASEDAKQALEDEKQAKLDEWDKKIKDKQAELDALNDESTDNQTKLQKLQAELALWQKEGNNPYAKSKVQELQTQIADLQKTIKKDNLSKDIKNLEDEKQADSDYYDKKIKAQEDADKKQQEEAEKTYKDMLDEKKAYQHIDQLLTKGGEDELLALLKKYDTSYKDIGKAWATNLTDPILDKINAVKKAMEDLKNEMSDTTSGGGSSSSSGGSSSSSDMKNVWISNGADTQVYTDSSGTESKGSLYSTGHGSSDMLKTKYEYKNGFYKIYDKDGNEIGWIQEKM